MVRLLLIITIVFTASITALGQGQKPQLLQKPTLSSTHIVFVYAGDLWVVGREGGDARRLTTGTGIESFPIFSPDGRSIAFTGEYEGNIDVYVVSADGGVPRRLTYHPGADVSLGWSPDGKRVLFRSARTNPMPVNRFFTMPIEGGFPTEIPLPMGHEAVYSPDGERLAYLPLAPAFQQWKRYRGGRTTKIWLPRA